MKIEHIIEQSKSIFSKDRNKLNEILETFEFDGKEYRKWKRLLRENLEHPFEVNYGLFDEIIDSLSAE